ncbi:MAG: rhomboid family intramembrane serine protease, partial [Anaerolineae bacterium]|nr:rhomboid family intramembrane serine protease [Anaerolineae bacterium]
MIMIIAYIIAFLAQYIVMLPLKDQRESQHRFPWLTFIIVLTNVLVYVGTVLLATRTAAATDLSYEAVYFNMLYPYMTIAGLTATGQGVGALSVLTSGFLHAGLGHLLGNMFILWFFGRKLEDAM